MKHIPRWLRWCFLMLLSARFVFVDDERSILGPLLMAFKEDDCSE